MPALDALKDGGLDLLICGNSALMVFSHSSPKRIEKTTPSTTTDL
jgi:hypothetical protein